MDIVAAPRFRCFSDKFPSETAPLTEEVDTIDSDVTGLK